MQIRSDVSGPMLLMIVVHNKIQAVVSHAGQRSSEEVLSKEGIPFPYVYKKFNVFGLVIWLWT